MIRVSHLSKSVTVSHSSTPRTLFHDFNLSFDRGECVALLGLNGAGKSTLLHILCGIEKEYEGKVYKEGRVAFMPQNYRVALLPWFTVFENIAYPLRWLGSSKRERLKRVEDVCSQYSFSLPLYSYPHVLSGGESQIVNLARLLITDPDILILDEPCAALDERSTRLVRTSIDALARKHAFSIIFVSHDIDEALLVADRVLVLHDSPARIALDERLFYSRPRSRDFLADSKIMGLKRDISAIFFRS